MVNVSFELTSVMAVFRQHSGKYNIMLLSSDFNFVSRFAREGSFPISCHNSSHRILFLKLDGILKFVKTCSTAQ